MLYTSPVQHTMQLLTLACSQQGWPILRVRFPSKQPSTALLIPPAPSLDLHAGHWYQETVYEVKPLAHAIGVQSGSY